MWSICSVSDQSLSHSTTNALWSSDTSCWQSADRSPILSCNTLTSGASWCLLNNLLHSRCCLSSFNASLRKLWTNSLASCSALTTLLNVDAIKYDTRLATLLVCRLPVASALSAANGCVQHLTSARQRAGTCAQQTVRVSPV